MTSGRRLFCLLLSIVVAPMKKFTLQSLKVADGKLSERSCWLVKAQLEEPEEQDGAGCSVKAVASLVVGWLLAGCLVVLCLAHQKALASACLMSSCRSERPPGCGVSFSPLFAARLLLFHTV